MSLCLNWFPDAIIGGEGVELVAGWRNAKKVKLKKVLFDFYKKGPFDAIGPNKVARETGVARKGFCPGLRCEGSHLKGRKEERREERKYERKEERKNSGDKYAIIGIFFSIFPMISLHFLSMT